MDDHDIDAAIDELVAGPGMNRQCVTLDMYLEPGKILNCFLNHFIVYTISECNWWPLLQPVHGYGVYRFNLGALS